MGILGSTSGWGCLWGPLTFAFLIMNFVCVTKNNCRALGNTTTGLGCTSGWDWESVRPNPSVLLRQTKQYLSRMSILLSGDIEENPGPRPPRYPCQVCGKAVTWRQRGIACDECERWHHCDCIGMKDCIYRALDGSNTSWHCTNCGMPNIASSFFNSTISYSGSSDDSLPRDAERQDPGPPMAASSPMQDRRTQRSQIPRNNNIKLIVINFQSIKNKALEVSNLIDSTDPDIIMGTETWLNEDFHSSEFFPPNYEVIRNDRIDGYGGVLLAVKSNLTISQIHRPRGIEAVTVKIKISKHQHLIVSSIYRPPNSNIDYMENICRAICEMKAESGNSTVWIGGDMNLPDIEWENLTIIGNQNPTELNCKFIDTINDCGLDQRVNFNTRGDKTLDLFLTNRPALVNRCTCLPGIGDHDIVFIDTNLKPSRAKPSKRKIYLWKKADVVSMQTKTRDLQRELQDSCWAEMDTESMWEKIKTSITKIMNDHVPTKLTSSRFNQPWVNTDVKRICRKKKKYFWKARQTGCPLARERFLSVKQEAKKVCKEAFKQYIHNLVDPDVNDNPKKFWTYINSKKCDNSGVAPLKNADGITYTDSNKKANIATS